MHSFIISILDIFLLNSLSDYTGWTCGSLHRRRTIATIQPALPNLIRHPSTACLRDRQSLCRCPLISNLNNFNIIAIIQLHVDDRVASRLPTGNPSGDCRRDSWSATPSPGFGHAYGEKSSSSPSARVGVGEDTA